MRNVTGSGLKFKLCCFQRMKHVLVKRKKSLAEGPSGVSGWLSTVCELTMRKKDQKKVK